MSQRNKFSKKKRKIFKYGLTVKKFSNSKPKVFEAMFHSPESIFKLTGSSRAAQDSKHCTASLSIKKIHLFLFFLSTGRIQRSCLQKKSIQIRISRPRQSLSRNQRPQWLVLSTFSILYGICSTGATRTISNHRSGIFRKGIRKEQVSSEFMLGDVKSRPERGGGCAGVKESTPKDVRS